MIGYPVSADLVGVKAFSTKTEVFFLSDVLYSFLLMVCYLPFSLLHIPNPPSVAFCRTTGRALGGVPQDFTEEYQQANFASGYSSDCLHFVRIKNGPQGQMLLQGEATER
jgi:hypothetical protein